SGPDGTFTLEGTPGGTVNLVATHPQYAQVTVAVVVREGAEAQARIEMSGGGGIRGSVTRAGVAVQGVRVQAWKWDGIGPVLSQKGATTDAQGRFEVNARAPGQDSVAVQSPG